MYNKYIFINKNRKKKQKELEEKKKLEDSQISFDMLIQTEKNENNNIKEINKKVEQNTLSLENNKLNNDNLFINSAKEQYQKNYSNSSTKKGRNLYKFVDDYVLVDIETTGLSPISDDIIEIGAIKVKDNEMVEQYNELININRDLTPFITSLTGITDEMLKSGKMPKVVFEEFVDFVGDNVIIGHNVNFDLGFLCDKCKKYLNYNLNNDYIDTLYLARKLIPNSMNYKLGTLAKLFNISYEGAHRGLKDVEITYEVYNKLRKIK